VPAAVLGSLAVAFVAFSSMMSSPDESAVANATTGPTASEIAAVVSASIPTGVSASEISSMVDSAISAGKETSAAELAAAITASAGDQLTAKEVEAIVTAAVIEAASAAEPAVALGQVAAQAIAITVDASRLVAVPIATPEPEVLSLASLVEVVSDTLTPTPAAPAQTPLTQAELAAIVTLALQEQRPLTAEQVAAIVDASLESLLAASGPNGTPVPGTAITVDASRLYGGATATPAPANAQLTAEQVAAIVAASIPGTVDAAEPSSAPAIPDDTTTFQNSSVNPFIDTRDDHLSTFAMDIDTASYAIARPSLRGSPAPGRIGPGRGVRQLLRPAIPGANRGRLRDIDRGAPSPFGDAGMQLLRVGIQGKVIGPEERKDASLVLVIDVSGSMREGNRLELVKDSVRILLDELGPGDEIGIVTYSSRAQNLLEPTSVENKDAILGALRGLTPQRSTNVEEGLQFGYHMARQMNRPGRITRVILLSDGVANVGNVEAESILDRVRLYLE
jgi:hypothetical protein